MRKAMGDHNTLVERLRDEIARPDTSGAPYVNDADLLAECLGEIDRLTAELAVAREALAKWMMQHGYATGHGDTSADLVNELDWQHKEKINSLTAEHDAWKKLADDLFFADEAEGTVMKVKGIRCVVYGCENRTGQGRFVGTMCAPCVTAIATGKAEHGTSWIFTQQAELAAARKANKLALHTGLMQEAAIVELRAALAAREPQL